jgi:asparagine synthase (glutamine-hydrolysing)
MCGIAGFLSTNNSFDLETLNSFVQSLHHRGPDAKGTFLENNVGLAHTRLSIIDVCSSANQPFVSRSGRYVIVYNGEVYNYKELKKRYNISTHTTSDTEIIVELFELLGTKCVEELRGMFAIVIYDKVEQSLTILRDRLGIKPLYYYQDKDSFVFASELKAICAIPKIKSKLTVDILASSHYLHLGFVPSPQSIFNEIKKFPSGHIGKISRNAKLQTTAYWRAENYLIDNELSYSASKNKIKDLLYQSVSEHLVSDVPIGLFLSGGIDSSLLAAITNEIQPSKITSYTVGFENSEHDEVPYAKEIAEYIGIKNKHIYLKNEDIIRIHKTLRNVYDEPFADTSAIPTLFVSEMASKEVKVVLSGEGADELFLGYGSHVWANRLNNKRNQFALFPLKVLHSFSKDKRIEKAIRLFSLSQKKTKASGVFNIEHELFSKTEIENINRDKKYEGFKFLLNNDDFINHTLFELNVALQDGLLVKMDRASMQHGLEARVPYLDHRMVEFTLSMIKKSQPKTIIGKQLLKEILFELVPKKYFNRKKWGFGIAKNENFRNHLKSQITLNNKENSLQKLFSLSQL